MPGVLRIATSLALVLVAALAADAPAQVLTICDIQYTADPDGDSPYHGQVVNCAGGVAVANLDRSVPRLFLQDPANPDAWGGIQVKDIDVVGAFDSVALGDWVELTNVEVEDHRGTTFLQWRPEEHGPGLTVTSAGNPLPEPIMLSVSDIAAPVYDPGEGAWLVANHNAECWESMRVIVRDVTVTDMDLGKADDNYNLQNTSGGDCWAADYLNQDKPYSWYYHRFVSVDQHFCAIGGVLEQYTHLTNGWDYYQLLTITDADLAICGDAASAGGAPDGEVTLGDLSRFTKCLVGPVCDTTTNGCDPPAWTDPPWPLPAYTLQHCVMMDLDYDGDVDLADFGGFQSMFGNP